MIKFRKLSKLNVFANGSEDVAWNLSKLALEQYLKPTNNDIKRLRDAIVTVCPIYAKRDNLFEIEEDELINVKDLFRLLINEAKQIANERSVSKEAEEN